MRANTTQSTMPRRRRGLLPGPTAKNNMRHFVRHEYHDLSSSAIAPTNDTQEFKSIPIPKVPSPRQSDANDPSNEGPETNSRGIDDAAADSLAGNTVEISSTLKTTSAAIDRPKKQRRGPRGGVAIPFPEKLFAMLSRIENDGYDDVISWQPHGRCFVIHRKELFVERIMPLYFRQTKLSSFQRQLNLYGFSRLTSGKDKGGYYHQLFLRGRPSLCKGMLRTKVKGTGIKPASSPETEPDFYSMPYVWEVKEEEKELIPHVMPNLPISSTSLITHLKKEVAIARAGRASSTSKSLSSLPTTTCGSHQSAPKSDSHEPCTLQTSMAGTRAVSENSLLELRTMRGTSPNGVGLDWKNPGVGTSTKDTLSRQLPKQGLITRNEMEWNPQEGNENCFSAMKRCRHPDSPENMPKSILSPKRQKVPKLFHGFHLEDVDDRRSDATWYRSHFNHLEETSQPKSLPEPTAVERLLTLEAASALMTLNGFA